MDDISAMSADSLLRRSPDTAYKTEVKRGILYNPPIYIMACTFSPACLFLSVRG